MLYIVRHARAEERRRGLKDANRALTEDGTKRFKHVVRGLRQQETHFLRVLHSPWRRARETAELLAPIAYNIVPEPLLAAEPSTELLGVLADGDAIVGHEPWLSELVSWLIAGDTMVAHVDMGKGTIAVLDGTIAPGEMTLAGLWRASWWPTR